MLRRLERTSQERDSPRQATRNRFRWQERFCPSLFIVLPEGNASPPRFQTKPAAESLTEASRLFSPLEKEGRQWPGTNWGHNGCFGHSLVTVRTSKFSPILPDFLVSVPGQLLASEFHDRVTYQAWQRGLLLDLIVGVVRGRTRTRNAGTNSGRPSSQRRGWDLVSSRISSSVKPALLRMASRSWGLAPIIN